MRFYFLYFFFHVTNPRHPPAPTPECCLPHLAGHLNPAVSAFALSWKQQCDRPWVGVRDELVGWWRGGAGFFFFFYSDRRVGAGSGLVALDWSETETADGERERGAALARERRSRSASHSPRRLQARCYCVLSLTSNQSTHLCAPRAGPAS